MPQTGHLDVVKYLAGKGADVYSKSDKEVFTAIYFASQNGHLDIVKYLVEEKGVDVNYRDEVGCTAIHAASVNGHLDVVKYLVGKGADVYSKCGEKGLTAIHYASLSGHLDIVKYLVEEKGVDVNCKDDIGTPLLHRAAAATSDNIAVVKYLVEKGADVNCEDTNEATYGYTALHYAAGSESDNISVAKYLVEKGADINHLGSDGRSPLDVARLAHHEEVIAFLIEKEKEIAEAKEKKTCAQKPDDWKAVVMKCGVDEEQAKIIVELFEENEIETSQFFDFTHELLKELGVKMGPRMKIMKYIEEHKPK